MFSRLESESVLVVIVETDITDHQRHNMFKHCSILKMKGNRVEVNIHWPCSCAGRLDVPASFLLVELAKLESEHVRFDWLFTLKRARNRTF